MADSHLLSPGDEFEKYVVEKELGHGGMGAVYLVRHRILDTHYALKVLYPEVAQRDRQYVERFIREGRLAGQIRHQNLIAVYDAGENDKNGMFYLVMDYVAGGSVRDKLRKDHYVDMLEAVSIIRQVASALEAAQNHNMVHRDIKPDNIMFDDKGVVRLADLGIAKATDDRDTGLTLEASVFGTPAYMSPEQARDSSKVDTRADIYSLGVVFYEMLSGRRPFGGTTSIEILSHVVDTTPAPDVRTYSPDLPADLAQLVSDMLEKDREKRVQSPTELIRRIDALDLSAYQEQPQGGEEELDVTLPTMVSPATPSAAKPDIDVTLPTMAAAPTPAPAAKPDIDVTLPTMAAAPTPAPQPAAKPDIDVTLPTMAAAPSPAPVAKPDIDVTLPTMAAAPSPAPATEENETMAMPSASSAQPEKQPGQNKRVLIFGAAGLVAVLVIVGAVAALFLGKKKTPVEGPTPSQPSQTVTEVIETPKAADKPSPAKPTPKTETDKPVPKVAETSPKTTPKTTEPSTPDTSQIAEQTTQAQPEPQPKKPEAKAIGLKQLGVIEEGSVVIFGADNGIAEGLYKELVKNEAFAKVGFQAAGDIKKWESQLREIQGKGPSFVVVAITSEKLNYQFKKTIKEIVNIIPDDRGAIFVSSSDSGIMNEVKESCNTVGMYFREWGANKELANYLLELKKELGW